MTTELRLLVASVVLDPDCLLRKDFIIGAADYILHLRIVVAYIPQKISRGEPVLIKDTIHDRAQRARSRHATNYTCWIHNHQSRRSYVSLLTFLAHDP